MNPLAEPSKLFSRFADDAGTDGAARDRFQMLVTDLVKVKHPDAATVEGPGNRDWGIDTFIGQLAGGDIRIWQSKFVLEWQDKTPQSQVRSSLQSALKQAAEHKHTISAWTLVVPCVLAPDQMKWFKGWVKKQSGSGVAIDMWDGTELRHQLLNRDAIHVRREYFPHTVAPDGAPSPHPAPRSERVAMTEDMSQFETALFVRQLREAGHVETDSACAHYFATDALIRDYEAKGQDDAVASMSELQLEVHDVWERHFNQERASTSADGLIPNLLHLVLDDVAKCDNPPGLYLARAHKKGTTHRLVEQQKAGWVTHWRGVVAEHLTATATPRNTAPIPPTEASDSPAARVNAEMSGAARENAADVIDTDTTANSVEVP
ncbi:hypothetical protein ACFWAY_22270 [Rhodococcus sp. NPDC059968]|uniref:hypothetical protein n=1 Tax=Rhodococcus sp. NPDC059968 TaxID=3347017 RepID=UPI0036728822